MGQQASQAHDSGPLQTASILTERINFARMNPSFMETNVVEDSLMSRLCCTQKKAPQWKDETLKYLESLQDTNWSKLLIKCLKQTNSEKIDFNYQADMYWVIKGKEPLPPSEVQESFVVQRPRLDIVPENRLESRGSEDRKEEGQSKPRNSNTSLGNILEKSHENKFLKEAATPLTFSIHRNSPGNDTYKEDRISSVLRKGSSPAKIDLFGTQYRPVSFENYSPVIKRADVRFRSNTAHKNCEQKYKLIIGILKKHLTDPANIFYRIIAVFGDYLADMYSKSLANLKMDESSKAKVEEYCAKATEDIKRFVEALYQSIRFYYQLDKVRRQPLQAEYETVFSKENLVISLTSIVFNQKIHKVLYDLYNMKNSKINESFEQQLQSWNNASLQNFGIPDELALNKKTIQYFQERRDSQAKSRGSESSYSNTFTSEDFKLKDIEQPEPGPERRMLSMNDEAVTTKMMSCELKRRRSEGAAFCSYEKVVQELKKLKSQTSPISKIETLVNAGEMIKASIKDFYNQFALRLEQNLDYRQILPIFFYAIVKSGLNDICTHLQLVEDFIEVDSLEFDGHEYIKMVKIIVNFISTTALKQGGNFVNIGTKFQDYLLKSVEGVSSGSPQYKETFIEQKNPAKRELL